MFNISRLLVDSHNYKPNRQVLNSVRVPVCIQPQLSCFSTAKDCLPSKTNMKDLSPETVQAE